MSANKKSSSRVVFNSILWGMIIPQSFLAALNVRGWALISGEAGKNQTNDALAIFSFELTLIIVAILIACLQRTKKIQIGWKITFASLISHAAYMWFLLISIESIVPDSIQPWILNEGNVGRWNITLFMPGAFISLYALSKFFFSRLTRANSALIVLLATIGMPLTWYLLVSLMQPAWFGQISVIASIVIGTTTVVVFLGTVIQFFDNIIHKPSSTKLEEKHYIIAVLIGLAAPLAGLALNQKIPFPADFQAIGVYALTFLNGLVLILSRRGRNMLR